MSEVPAAPLFQDANPVEAHVVMTDMVCFSKLKQQEQHLAVIKFGGLIREVLDELKIEHQNPEHALALPTGDGWAICFFKQGHRANAVNTAIELNRRFSEVQVTSNGELIPRGLRIGIASGRLWVYPDQRVKSLQNVVGNAINDAERIMSVGDAKHILCSADIASDIRKDDTWKDLMPLNRTVYSVMAKHGEAYKIASIHGPWKDKEIGNERVPDSIRTLAARASCLMREFKIRPDEMPGLAGVESKFAWELVGFAKLHQLPRAWLQLDVKCERFPFAEPSDSPDGTKTA